MPSVWTRARAAIDPLARLAGYYTAYPLTEPEYIGRVEDVTIEDARVYLDTSGYTPQYLSAAKKHPRTGWLHDLSYRRVPTQHPEQARGSVLTRRYEPEACQLHTHWFKTRDGFDVYSHYELRPDLFQPSFDLERLKTHYSPSYGDTYLRGVTDLKI